MSTLNIPYLRSYWLRALSGEASTTPDLDATLLSGLGLNVLETSRFLYQQRPTFEQFEEWIVATAGEEMEVDRLRRALNDEDADVEDVEDTQGLTEEDLAHWDEYGYVIVRNAVSAQMAKAAEVSIYEYLRMDTYSADTWYSNNQGHSIWVDLLRHPAFRANRRSPRLVKAFAQLWGTQRLVEHHRPGRPESA